MNSKFCLLFLLVVCIAASVSAKPQGGSGSCGKNEEFTSCGSACPPKCDERNGPNFCTLQCIVGCQCKRGYVLNNQGRCVLLRDC
ncbi:chymotrypsin inhibitor-like [Zeugodacus cucurbitae]|uniref:chymotrypsin inhibitor-like n=1 Tax=Zeugodacus cucurbitae TaxID=28588 RepID=UPI0005967ED4|nr:chymotrypsin inhibitor-like [Zeugodacus cucurbitae]